MSRSERIAVTGVGLVSALGWDATSSYRKLLAGERGFREVQLFDVSGQRSRLAAEVSGLDALDLGVDGENWSRSDVLALLAVRDALSSAGLDAAARFSLSIGASTGGMYEAEGVLGGAPETHQLEASARRLLSYPLSTTADRLSSAFDGVERARTICSACSSSANAVVQGAAWLRSGVADCVLSGGTDGLCSLTFTGFNALGASDPGPCRPFDKKRAGLTLGEGAAFLVLEPESRARRRGARVLAFLTGWAAAAEAHHITHPEPSGVVAARLLSSALASAGLAPGDLDYVNAHGTGTEHNDAMEARALGLALGRELERVFVSSSKGQVGHTLGAAGAVEAAFTVLSLDNQSVPPTGGLVEPDAGAPLRHVFERGLKTELRAALSSSFGFGGSGCVLVFENPTTPAPARAEFRAPTSAVVTGVSSLSVHGLLAGAAVRKGVDPGEGARPGVGLDELGSAGLDEARSRRFDRATSLSTLGAQAALADAALAPAGTGLVLGAAFGNVERCVHFLRRVLARGPRFASPAEFPHLVPSPSGGNASIYLGLTGPVLSVSDLVTSGEAACETALGFVELGLSHAVVAGDVEALDPIVSRVLGPLCEGTESDLPRTEGGGFLVFEEARRAQARGARVAARVLAHAHCRVGVASLLAKIGEPERGARLVLLALSNWPELDRELGTSAWRRATRRRLAPSVGFHEGIGAVGLAAAVALLLSRECDEVLVLSRRADSTYAFRLAQPSAEPGSTDAG